MWRLGFKIIVLLSVLLAVQNIAAIPMTESDGNAAATDAKIENLEKISRQTCKRVDSLQVKNVQRDSMDNIQSLQIDSVGKKLDNTDAMLDSVKAEIMMNRRSVEDGFRMFIIFGIAGLLIGIIITITIYYLLKKRMENDDRDIKSIMETIAANSGENHSLVLSIVNEMARIEQNLLYMDAKTKGVSQLKNRVAAIASALVANGYEVPKLINTEYKEGMNFEVVMEEDETIALHEQRIKRVMQPCVIYNGVMIQTAKVVVAYNPCEDN